MIIALSTALAVLLGAYIGYSTAGVGGAMLFGALIGVGGALLGLVIARTAILLHRWWWLALLAAVVIVLVVFTWGVYL